MALPKFLLFFIFSSLLFTVIASTELSDSVAVGEVIGAVSETESSDASLRVQLHQLKSKISLFESKIGERMQELRSKEKTIKGLEMVIEEKSNSLSSLQSQMQLLKEKAYLNAQEQEDRANTHARELEEQINNLRKEIEAQNKKKDALEARATIAERKIQDLKVKLEHLHKKTYEQRSRILNTQHAFLVAEEELVKAKLEAASISKQLIEVHEAWIPPWLVVHIDHIQSLIMSNWNKHGRPALDLTKEKALEKKCEFEKWLRPPIDTFKSEWVPIIKQQWLAFVNDFRMHLRSLTDIAIDKYHLVKESIEPHVVNLISLFQDWIPVIRECWSAFVNDFGRHLQSLTKMAIDKCHVTRIFLEPHIVRRLQVVHPYFQEVKKFMEPYVEQVSSLTKPQMDKTCAFLKPYTIKILQGYKKSVRKVNVCHQQVQAAILDILKGHGFTRPLATKELVWYMASVLMLLPVIIVFNIVSSLFPEKPKKHFRTSHSGHTPRRAKRSHSER